MDNISSDQILGYLKGKYLSKPAQKTTTAPTNDDNVKKDEVVGAESDMTGESAENQFLLRKLGKVEAELTKWLEILKNKL